MIGAFIIVIGTFLGMEFMAWFTHKYVMHGLMWYFHSDHHVHQPGFFERNDVFFLIFAIPSALCFIYGSMNGIDYRVWIGTGIAVYGFCYFMVHDVFIHQRFKWLRRSDHPYFMAIRKAHKVHHKHLGKEQGECFGMLLVPVRFFREAAKASKQKRSKSVA
ncbi:MAG: beta-carotene 3-hydroxylase [Flavobacteriales bacterium]|jgi:beta-carotene 3-hydroxylase